MQRIKIGIIGCGHWGPNFIRNFSQISATEIVGICEINPEKLVHIKNNFPNIQIYRNYHNLLKNNKLDAVIVATPASTHYAITKEALERDKHVLVEKPLSTDLKQAKKLNDISKKVKKVLMVGHTFLYNPAVKKIKDIVQRRDLGKIYYIHARRTNLGPLRKDVNAIWDLSPHDISIINFITGKKPEEVCAYAQRFLSHKLEDVGFITLRYPNDILAHIHVSWLDPKKIREMTVIGSKRMLVYDDTNINEPVRVYDKNVMRKRYERKYYTFEEFQLIVRDGEVRIPKINMEEPLKIECRHFIDCITNREKPFTDGKNGVDIVRISAAIQKSIENNSKKIKV
jgi:predicted dehydrogenase